MDLVAYVVITTAPDASIPQVVNVANAAAFGTREFRKRPFFASKNFFKNKKGISLRTQNTINSRRNNKRLQIYL